MVGLTASPSAAFETDTIPFELRVKLDTLSRAFADCTAAAARQKSAVLTPDTIDRIVIGECADAHGDLVELSWGLPTPAASQVLLTATIRALAAARRQVAD